MTIDWPYFLAVLLLLWLPRQVLRWGRNGLRFGRSRRGRRTRDTNPAKTREPGDPRVSFRAEIAKVRNHIDFVRAALGSALVAGTFPGLDAAVRAEVDVVNAPRLVLLVTAAVLTVGVLVQVIRYEHRVALYAPVFYLSGLTVGLCGLYPALFALVLVWTINLALFGAAAFLSVHALLVLTFGVLFRGIESRLPFVAAGLIFLPVVLSLLTRRRLGMFTKRMKL